MGRAIIAGELVRDLDPSWPPWTSIEEGWRHLGPEAREQVLDRTREMRERFELHDHVNQAALRRLFSFLAHVETVAIDVPLMALPTTTQEGQAMLERQLADEVFHAVGFARLATDLGGIEDPMPEADAVLERIRAPQDPRVRAALLNLIAEDWIETLFKHAATWEVADPVFRMVLADESRHIHEGHHHTQGLEAASIEPAVRDLEQALFELMQCPRVVLPTLALAGAEEVQALSKSYLRTHEAALEGLGLAPPEGFEGMIDAIQEVEDQGSPTDAMENARHLEPETQWRRTALHLWDQPRHPVMHGWFDVTTEHIPTDLLTPVLVAAVGKVWHAYPRVNRYTLGGELYEPAGVNVGVRVTIGEQGEALSTIVVPDAHRRSVQDIQHLLEAGVREMNGLSDQIGELEAGQATGDLASVLRDDELMALVPPEVVPAPVTISNVGRSGMIAGVGAMPGALGQSVELIAGREEKRPVWDGERYVPADRVTLGASADHRVIDGHHAGEAMARLQDALDEEGTQEIMAREDTVPSDAPLDDVLMGTAGTSQHHARLLLSCKAPFWIGWICWLFKK